MTTSTIKRADGVPGGIDVRDPQIAVPFSGRVGNCYEFAARYIAEPGRGEPVLVHGSIQRYDHPRLDHAWVEVDGDVFEPTSGHRMTAAEFGDYFRPVERVRYSRERVYVEMLRHETYGPWDPKP